AAHQRLHPLPTRRSSDLGGNIILTNRNYDFGSAEVTQLEMDLSLHDPDGALIQSLGRIPYTKSVVVRTGSAPYIGRPWFTPTTRDRKSTRLNSSHVKISY